MILKKKQQTTKICKNYPGGKESRKEKSVSHFKTVHELEEFVIVDVTQTSAVIELVHYPI